MFGLLLIFAFVYAFAWIVYRRYFFFPRIQFEDLRGRRVIITGASRGIGEELAYEYSRYQCRLLLAARSFDVLEDRVARRCRELGATSVQCLKFDAAKEEDSRKLIERANECYGGIDILLLNHTASVYRPFLRHDRRQNIEEMINLMQTNFFGYFYSTMFALPYLLRSGTAQRPSQIIAVSSLAGTCPLPKTTIYGTTKHAIQGFFLNLSREVRSSEGHVSTTLAILGLIGTEHALKETDRRLHFLAADVRKTAKAILAAGVSGQTRMFYPYFFSFIPPLYYLFPTIFELLTRLGN